MNDHAVIGAAKTILREFGYSENEITEMGASNTLVGQIALEHFDAEIEAIHQPELQRQARAAFDLFRDLLRCFQGIQRVSP